MSEILTGFWEKHPVDDGWSIITESDAGGSLVKASIKRGDYVIVTAHAQGSDRLEDLEQVAIERAIKRLDGRFE